MKTSIIKIISIFLILCFVFQEISFANPNLELFSWSHADAASKSWAKSLLRTLPESIAVIEDAWRAEDSSKLIYLIQDAHTNSSGQLNVAKTLDFLFRHPKRSEGSKSEILRSPRRLQNDGVKYIFLEAGSGDLSLSFLRKDSSLEKRKQIGLSYLKKGELQGSEYLDLTSQQKIILWGVEDEALYKKALETFRSIKKEETKYRDYLERVEKTIKLLKPRVLNPFLLDFDQKKEKYKKEELTLTQYFDILLEESGHLDLSLKSYPNLKRLNKLKKLEQAIDFQKANDEQKKAIASLSPQDQKELFVSSLENHGPSKLGSEEKKVEKAFFALLEEKLVYRHSEVAAATEESRIRSLPVRQAGFAAFRMMDDYPNLSRYFGYLKESKKIDLKEILKEQQKLEADILKALTVSDEERDLLKSSGSVEFLKKLLNLTITPEDYEQYKQNKEYFDVKKITGFLNKKIMLLRQLYEDAVFLEDGYEETIQKCEEFYELTYQRDQAFIRNMIDKMEGRASKNTLGAGDAGGEASAARGLGSSTAVLITGGYHTPNLKYLLKKQNISYIVLTPQIFHETNQKRYEKLLLSQKIQSSAPRLGVGASTHAMMLGQVMTDYLGIKDKFVRDVSDKEPLYALAGSRLAGTRQSTASPDVREPAGSRLAGTRQSTASPDVREPAGSRLADANRGKKIEYKRPMFISLLPKERIDKLMNFERLSGVMDEDDLDELTTFWQKYLEAAQRESVLSEIERARLDTGFAKSLKGISVSAKKRFAPGEGTRNFLEDLEKFADGIKLLWDTDERDLDANQMIPDLLSLLQDSGENLPVKFVQGPLPLARLAPDRLSYLLLGFLIPFIHQPFTVETGVQYGVSRTAMAEEGFLVFNIYAENEAPGNIHINPDLSHRLAQELGGWVTDIHKGSQSGYRVAVPFLNKVLVDEYKKLLSDDRLWNVQDFEVDKLAGNAYWVHVFSSKNKPHNGAETVTGEKTVTEDVPAAAADDRNFEVFERLGGIHRALSAEVDKRLRRSYSGQLSREAADFVQQGIYQKPFYTIQLCLAILEDPESFDRVLENIRLFELARAHFREAEENMAEIQPARAILKLEEAKKLYESVKKSSLPVLVRETEENLKTAEHRLSQAKYDEERSGDLFDVYDEKGVKADSQTTYLRALREGELMAGVTLFVFDSKRRVLLQRRKKDQFIFPFPGTLAPTIATPQLPQHAGPLETLQDAATKQLGISLKAERLKKMQGKEPGALYSYRDYYKMVEFVALDPGEWAALEKFKTKIEQEEEKIEEHSNRVIFLVHHPFRRIFMFALNEESRARLEFYLTREAVGLGFRPSSVRVHNILRTVYNYTLGEKEETEMQTTGEFEWVNSDDLPAQFHDNPSGYAADCLTLLFPSDELPAQMEDAMVLAEAPSPSAFDAAKQRYRLLLKLLEDDTGQIRRVYYKIDQLLEKIKEDPRLGGRTFEKAARWKADFINQELSLLGDIDFFSQVLSGERKADKEAMFERIQDADRRLEDWMRQVESKRHENLTSIIRLLDELKDIMGKCRTQLLEKIHQASEDPTLFYVIETERRKKEERLAQDFEWKTLKVLRLSEMSMVMEIKRKENDGPYIVKIGLPSVAGGQNNGVEVLKREVELNGLVDKKTHTLGAGTVKRSLVPPMTFGLISPKVAALIRTEYKRATTPDARARVRDPELASSSKDLPEHVKSLEWLVEGLPCAYSKRVRADRLDASVQSILSSSKDPKDIVRRTLEYAVNRFLKGMRMLHEDAGVVHMDFGSNEFMSDQGGAYIFDYGAAYEKSAEPWQVTSLPYLRRIAQPAAKAFYRRYYEGAFLAGVFKDENQEKNYGELMDIAGVYQTLTDIFGSLPQEPEYSYIKKAIKDEFEKFIEDAIDNFIKKDEAVPQGYAISYFKALEERLNAFRESTLLNDQEILLAKLQTVLVDPGSIQRVEFYRNAKKGNVYRLLVSFGGDGRISGLAAAKDGETEIYALPLNENASAADFRQANSGPALALYDDAYHKGLVARYVFAEWGGQAVLLRSSGKGNDERTGILRSFDAWTRGVRSSAENLEEIREALKKRGFGENQTNLIYDEIYKSVARLKPELDASERLREAYEKSMKVYPSTVMRKLTGLVRGKWSSADRILVTVNDNSPVLVRSEASAGVASQYGFSFGKVFSNIRSFEEDGSSGPEEKAVAAMTFEEELVPYHVTGDWEFQKLVSWVTQHRNMDHLGRALWKLTDGNSAKAYEILRAAGFSGARLAEDNLTTMDEKIENAIELDRVYFGYRTLLGSLITMMQDGSAQKQSVAFAEKLGSLKRNAESLRQRIKIEKKHYEDVKTDARKSIGALREKIKDLIVQNTAVDIALISLPFKELNKLSAEFDFPGLADEFRNRMREILHNSSRFIASSPYGNRILLVNVAVGELKDGLQAVDGQVKREIVAAFQREKKLKDGDDVLNRFGEAIRKFRIYASHANYDIREAPPKNPFAKLGIKARRDLMEGRFTKYSSSKMENFEDWEQEKKDRFEIEFNDFLAERRKTFLYGTMAYLKKKERGLQMQLKKISGAKRQTIKKRIQKLHREIRGELMDTIVDDLIAKVWEREESAEPGKFRIPSSFKAIKGRKREIRIRDMVDEITGATTQPDRPAIVDDNTARDIFKEYLLDAADGKPYLLAEYYRVLRQSREGIVPFRNYYTGTFDRPVHRAKAPAHFVKLFEKKLESLETALADLAKRRDRNGFNSAETRSRVVSLREVSEELHEVLIDWRLVWYEALELNFRDMRLRDLHQLTGISSVMEAETTGSLGNLKDHLLNLTEDLWETKVKDSRKDRLVKLEKDIHIGVKLVKRPMDDASLLLIEDNKGNYWTIFTEFIGFNAFNKKYHPDKKDRFVHQIYLGMLNVARGYVGRKIDASVIQNELIPDLRKVFKKVAGKRPFQATKKAERKGDSSAELDRLTVFVKGEETRLVNSDGEVFDYDNRKHDLTLAKDVTKDDLRAGEWKPFIITLDGTFIVGNPISHSQMKKNPEIISIIFNDLDALSAGAKELGLTESQAEDLVVRLAMKDRALPGGDVPDVTENEKIYRVVSAAYRILRQSGMTDVVIKEKIEKALDKVKEKANLESAFKTFNASIQKMARSFSQGARLAGTRQSSASPLPAGRQGPAREPKGSRLAEVRVVEAAVKAASAKDSIDDLVKQLSDAVNQAGSGFQADNQSSHLLVRPADEHFEELLKQIGMTHLADHASLRQEIIGHFTDQNATVTAVDMVSARKKIRIQFKEPLFYRGLPIQTVSMELAAKESHVLSKFVSYFSSDELKPEDFKSFEDAYLKRSDRLTFSVTEDFTSLMCLANQAAKKEFVDWLGVSGLEAKESWFVTEAELDEIAEQRRIAEEKLREKAAQEALARDREKAQKDQKETAAEQSLLKQKSEAKRKAKEEERERLRLEKEEADKKRKEAAAEKARQLDEKRKAEREKAEQIRKDREYAAQIRQKVMKAQARVFREDRPGPEKREDLNNLLATVKGRVIANIMDTQGQWEFTMGDTLLENMKERISRLSDSSITFGAQVLGELNHERFIVNQEAQKASRELKSLDANIIFARDAVSMAMGQSVISDLVAEGSIQLEKLPATFRQGAYLFTERKIDFTGVDRSRLSAHLKELKTALDAMTDHSRSSGLETLRVLYADLSRIADQLLLDLEEGLLDPYFRYKFFRFFDELSVLVHATRKMPWVLSSPYKSPESFKDAYKEIVRSSEENIAALKLSVIHTFDLLFEKSPSWVSSFLYIEPEAGSIPLVPTVGKGVVTLSPESPTVVFNVGWNMTPSTPQSGSDALSRARLEIQKALELLNRTQTRELGAIQDLNSMIALIDNPQTTSRPILSAYLTNRLNMIFSYLSQQAGMDPDLIMAANSLTRAVMALSSGARLAAKVVYENTFAANQFTGDDPEAEEHKLDVQKNFEGAILSALVDHGVVVEKAKDSPYSLKGLAKAFMSEVFQNSMQRARTNPEGNRQIRLVVVDTGSAVVASVANRTTDASEEIRKNIRNFNDKLNQTAVIDDSLVEDIPFGEDIIKGYGFGIRIVSDMLKALYPTQTGLLELGSENDPDGNDWMVVTMRLPVESLPSAGARLASEHDGGKKKWDRMLMQDTPGMFIKEYRRDPNGKWHGVFVAATNKFARSLGKKSVKEVVGTTDFEQYPGKEASEYYAEDLNLIESVDDPSKRVLKRKVKRVSSLGEVRYQIVRTRIKQMKDGSFRVHGRIVDITNEERFRMRLEAEHRVARVLAESDNLKEAAPKIIQAINKNLDWEVGAIWDVNSSGQRLLCADAGFLPEGKSEEFLDFVRRTREITFLKGVGLPGRVWQTGDPAWIEDVTKDANFPRAPFAAAANLHGAFAFPIILEGKVLSVIEFFSSEIRAPDEELLAMMAAVGSQIGQFVRRRQVEFELKGKVEELKGALEDLDTAQKQAFESEKLAMMGELAAAVAHEVNNPLSVILLLAERSVEKIESFKKSQVSPPGGFYDFLNGQIGDLKVMVDAARRCAKIVKDLLSISKPATGEFDLLNINEIIEETLGLRGSSYVNKNIQVVKEFDPQLPAVNGDKTRFEQVLLNLILNAEQAMPKGGELIVRTRYDAVNGRVEIDVEDTGIGMSDETLGKIFSPFFTTKTGKSGALKGTGLGLSTSRKIVAAHGGTIEVKSKAGVGTTFTISLPGAHVRKGKDQAVRRAMVLQAKLIGNYIHKFNNLLTIIAGYSEILFKSNKPDDFKKWEKEIIKLSGKMGALEDKILSGDILTNEEIYQALSDTQADIQNMITALQQLYTLISGIDVSLAGKLKDMMMESCVKGLRLLSILKDHAVYRTLRREPDFVNLKQELTGFVELMNVTNWVVNNGLSIEFDGMADDVTVWTDVHGLRQVIADILIYHVNESQASPKYVKISAVRGTDDVVLSFRANYFNLTPADLVETQNLDGDPVISILATSNEPKPLAAAYEFLRRVGAKIEARIEGSESVIDVHFPSNERKMSRLSATGVQSKPSLPLEEAPRAAPAAVKSAHEIHAAPVLREFKKPMLIDDEVQNREFYPAFLAGLFGLSENDFTVVESPEKALQLLGEDPKRIDILVTDIGMPGIGGKEGAMRIRELTREKNPDLIIVTLSGFGPQAPEAKELLAAGIIQDAWGKPFDGKEIMASLEKLKRLPMPQGARLAKQDGLPKISPRLEEYKEKLNGLNIAQAAELMNVSPSALSQHLQYYTEDFEEYGIKKQEPVIPSLLQSFGREKLEGKNIAQASQLIGVSISGLSGHLQSHPEDFGTYGIKKGEPGAKPVIPNLLQSFGREKLESKNISQVAQLIGMSVSGLLNHLQSHPEDFETYGIEKGKGSSEPVIPTLLQSFGREKLNGFNISQAAQLIGVSISGLSGHLQSHPEDFETYGIIKPIKPKDTPALLESFGRKKLKGKSITQAAELIGVSLSVLYRHLQSHPEDFKRYGIKKLRGGRPANISTMPSRFERERAKRADKADDKTGARMAGNTLVANALKQARGTSAWEFISALGLERALVVKTESTIKIPGLKIYSIQIDAPVAISLDPLQGPEILYNELARTAAFKLLFDSKDRLIAVFPSPDGLDAHPSEENGGFFYFNLADFYVRNELLKEVGKPSARLEWETFVKDSAKDKTLIAAYLDAWRRRSEQTNAHEIRINPKGLSARGSFIYAELNQFTGEVEMLSFDPAKIFGEGHIDTNGNDLASRILQPKPGFERVVFPLLPTVYSPAFEMNAEADKILRKRVFQAAEDLKTGEKICDVGTGSGILTWIMNAAAKKHNKKIEYYALDLNPLAVANARILARLGGYKLKSVVHDNLYSREGQLAFPGEKFPLIIANSPRFEAAFQKNGEDYHSKALSDLHDLTSLRFAENLARTLSENLTEHGRAIVWDSASPQVRGVYKKNNFELIDLDPLRGYDFVYPNPVVAKVAADNRVAVYLILRSSAPKGARLAATRPSSASPAVRGPKDAFQTRYRELSDFLRSVGSKYPSLAPFVSGEKRDFLNWLKGNLRDPDANVKQLEPDSLRLPVWQKDAKSGEPSIESYFNEILTYPEFVQLTRTGESVPVNRTEFIQKLYQDGGLKPDETINFIIKVHNVQPRSGGKIVISSTVFDVIFDEKENHLKIYGYDRLLFEGKPHKFTTVADDRYKVGISLVDFKTMLERSYEAVHGSFKGLAKGFYATKAVVEIDLDGLKSDSQSFSQVIAPLLVREMDLAHSKVYGKEAKFLLKGNRRLKGEVMRQMKAFYEKNKPNEIQDFVVEDENDLKDHKNAPRVVLMAPGKGIEEGKRYFFYKALGPGDFPNLRGHFEVSLTLRRIKELDAADPSYKKVRQATLFLLGLEKIDDKQFIKVLKGEERNVEILMLYAVPPITRLAIEVLVRGARLAAKMAEQAA